MCRPGRRGRRRGLPRPRAAPDGSRQDPKGKPTGGWHPEHLLTLDETLGGFTSGAAYAAFAEDRLGTLAPGRRADVTIVDRDLFRVSPRELLDSKVLMTVVEGKVVFELNGSR